jgi:hypothetical protein
MSQYSVSLARSQTVSVTTVKYDGDFTHPMGRVRGGIKGSSSPDCGNRTNRDDPYSIETVRDVKLDHVLIPKVWLAWAYHISPGR